MDFGEEPDNWSNGNKRKKRYHRHTPRQIQLLESYISSLFISIQFLILCMYFCSFCDSLLIFSHIYRMFKECPHPDEKQRLHLSRELGLDPRQIKFWFQNRRTQMKVTSAFPFWVSILPLFFTLWINARYYENGFISKSFSW